VAKRVQQLACAAVALIGITLAAQPVGQPVPSARDAMFRVATWNIRSGMGIRGFTTRHWSHDTLNCSDRSKPMNAWGVGLPQQILRQLRDDPTLVALAVQEAWNCGAPVRINEVLGFKLATREQEGVALLARHGLKGAPVYRRIDDRHNRWVIGGTVCLDAACSAAVPMFSTHWGSPADDDFPRQAQATVAALRDQPQPHLVMGDLNVFRIDQWNPRTRCTQPDSTGRTNALAVMEGAGYVDAWKATQSGEGWTGMTSRPGCGRPDGSLYKRIDYVFTRGLRAVRVTRFARPEPGADAPSDHVGLMAELLVSSTK
jgi:endonuclease/exonuclease/phosphatase family metal-dependent hydrolase